MKIKSKRKEEAFFFIGILMLNIIVLSNFLKMHYAQETYRMNETGFSYAAKNAFLKSGRPITACIYYLSNFLRININVYVIIMSIISVIAISLAIYTLFKTLDNLQTKKTICNSIIVFMLSYIVVLNFCTTDLLVFAESGVLCVALFFAVKASTLNATDSKYKYLKMAIYSVIVVFCHQAILNLYIPLSLMIIVIKHKDNTKKAFKEGMLVLVIYSVALLINILTAKCINPIIGINSRPTMIPTLKYVIGTYIKYLDYMLVNTLYIGAKFWYIAVMSVITVIYFVMNILNKNKKIYLFYYVVILISAILLPIMPLIIQEESEQYLELRMCLSFGASIGIMLIYIFATLNLKSEKLFNLLILITSIVFILNGMYIVHSSSQMVATNLLDRNLAITMINRIEKYEKENDITVKNIAIDFDTNPEYYYAGSKRYRCLTLKSFATDWSVIGILETYSNRTFNRVDMLDTIHTKYFENKNWNCYDEEQCIFLDDTLYFCIY